MSKVKKGDTPTKKYEWEYRLKVQFKSKTQHSNWVKCTLEEKDKIFKMYPTRYDFRELEKIQPTENMTVEKDFSENQE